MNNEEAVKDRWERRDQHVVGSNGPKWSLKITYVLSHIIVQYMNIKIENLIVWN